MNDTLERFYKRIRMSVGRAIIKRVNDDEKIQLLQLGIMANETRANIENIQQYGFTSVPLAGAEALVVSIGGNRDHSIVVATADSRYRLKGMQDGEVAIHTDEGDSIILKRGNLVEVNTKTYKVNTENYIVNATAQAEFNTPIVKAKGDIIDNHESNNATLAQVRTQSNTHDHNENNNTGGPTDPPNTTAS